jgi:hypothetical protein
MSYIIGALFALIMISYNNWSAYRTAKTQRDFQIQLFEEWINEYQEQELAKTPKQNKETHDWIKEGF